MYQVFKKEGGRWYIRRWAYYLIVGSGMVTIAYMISRILIQLFSLIERIHG